MIFRKIELKDSKQFCNLIIDMYKHLENLEWFSPMPYDIENVENMIANPRFYILGVFDNDFLCAVSSFDYKCGKLLDKIVFPKDCNTDKLVEIGFTMVHSKYRGQGIMKQMINFLINEAKSQGLEWIFGKINEKNFASSKSFIHSGFEKHCDYNKPISINDIKALLSSGNLNTEAKTSIEIKLSNTDADDEFIYTNYEILLKKI